MNTLHQILCVCGGYTDQRTNQRNAGLLVGMGQEAVITDFGKTAGQHVQEKSPDKLPSAEGEFFFLIVVAAVPIPEADLAIIDSDDPVVGYCHPVGIPTEIYLLPPSVRPSDQVDF